MIKFIVIKNGGDFMTVSKAQMRATAKYEKSNYDKILLRLTKGEKDKYQMYAKSKDESLNGFIVRAMREAMQRDEQEL